MALGTNRPGKKDTMAAAAIEKTDEKVAGKPHRQEKMCDMKNTFENEMALKPKFEKL